MPLDPSTAVVLRALAAAGASALASGTPESARAYARANTGAGRYDPALLARVASIENARIPGPDGDLNVRIYRPAAAGPRPTVVYFHGGGFVIDDLDSHDDHCRLICRDVDAVVMSVEYRLAPEARFPKPLQDALAATRWAADNIARLGADPTRLAVAGDSAGGNLAAAVAIALAGTPTRVILAEPHEDLAPAVIGVGEYDLLRDEVLAYAARIQAAGVPVFTHCFEGLVHGYFGMSLLSPAAAQAIATMNQDLRKLLDVQR